MIARTETQFHFPGDGTEIQSDRHYQSTETPSVLGGEIHSATPTGQDNPVMTTLSQYKKAHFLFRQGDASDHVLLARSGAIAQAYDSPRSAGAKVPYATWFLVKLSLYLKDPRLAARLATHLQAEHRQPAPERPAPERPAPAWTMPENVIHLRLDA